MNFEFLLFFDLDLVLIIVLFFLEGEIFFLKDIILLEFFFLDFFE